VLLGHGDEVTDLDHDQELHPVDDTGDRVERLQLSRLARFPMVVSTVQPQTGDCIGLQRPSVLRCRAALHRLIEAHPESLCRRPGVRFGDRGGERIDHSGEVLV